LARQAAASGQGAQSQEVSVATDCGAKRGNSTLLDVPRLLDDFLVARVSKVPGQLPRRTISPIQNKIGEFLVNPILRRVVDQAKSSFDLRQVMDEGILLVSLAKGKVGKILQRFWESCSQPNSAWPRSAARILRKPSDVTSIYIDKFPAFTTTTFAGIFSKMHKCRLNLGLAHQYIAQVETVRDAILGNAGTIIDFVLGLNDELVLEKEFHPGFTAEPTQLRSVFEAPNRRRGLAAVQR